VPRWCECQAVWICRSARRSSTRILASSAPKGHPSAALPPVRYGAGERHRCFWPPESCSVIRRSQAGKPHPPALVAPAAALGAATRRTLRANSMLSATDICWKQRMLNTQPVAALWAVRWSHRPVQQHPGPGPTELRPAIIADRAISSQQQQRKKGGGVVVGRRTERDSTRCCA